jgi:hypothetical protein
MQRARGWSRFMFPNRLGPAVLQAQLDPETAGAHAAKSIRKHTEETHAAALRLIDELLSIGPRTAPSAPLPGLACDDREPALTL